GHHAVVRHADDVGDVRVGHLAFGLEIPVVMPFAGATHVLGEDVYFLRDQRTVALAHRRGADELAARNVGDASLEDPHDHEIVGELDVHALPAAVLDGQVLSLDLLDGAPDSHGRIGGRLREGNCGDGSGKESDSETRHCVLRMRSNTSISSAAPLSATSPQLICRSPEMLVSCADSYPARPPGRSG